MGWFDALDNALTDARGRRSARVEAFKKSCRVKRGDKIWTVTETKDAVSGKKVPLARSYTITKVCPVRGPLVGSETVEGMILRQDVYTSQPRGVLTAEEYDSQQVAGPDGNLAAEMAAWEKRKDKREW